MSVNARRAIYAWREGQVIVVFGVYSALFGHRDIERVLQEQIRFPTEAAKQKYQVGQFWIFHELMNAVLRAERQQGT